MTRNRLSKFGAKRSGGFASKLEHAVYDILKARENSGEIQGLKCQVQIELTDAKIIYKPDFAYMENGKATYAEAKGFETAVWKIKKRLWGSYGPGILYIYSGNYHSPFIVDTVRGKW